MKKWFKTFYRIITINILCGLCNSYTYESPENQLKIT